ncbi:cell wall-binding repeat-containing protein [Nostocoides vanveenii]|uniref:Cell wall-binding protein n=1 Tax=Nostocoides vanveenii TaxID=330835 RepID=A0ABP4WX08_9MICO
MPRPQPVCRSLIWAFALLAGALTLPAAASAPLAGAAVAGAAGADPALLRVADRAAMTITTDALSVSTVNGSTTYSYDPATSAVGSVLADRPGSAYVRWAPGGDVSIEATATAWITRDRTGAQVATYPRTAGSLAPAWFPTGDGFIEQAPRATTAQSTTAGRVWRQPVAGGRTAYGSFAMSPYGSEAVVRTTNGTISNLLLVSARGPMTLAGQPERFPAKDYFVSSYRPGDPDIAQEPGKGVRDASARTFVAFLGVEPGTTKASLFVDYQDGRLLTAPLQPTAVVEAGMPCTTVAPAFSPDRRQIAYLVGVAPGTAPCTQMAVRVVTMGASGTYDPATAKTLVTSPAGTPYTSISWRAKTAPAQVVRIGGADRYEVGVNVSRSVYAAGAAGGVVIAGGEAYADALAGSPLAAALRGPLMLSKRDSLDPRVLEEAIRVLAPNAPIYVLGGPATISEAVLTALRGTGHPVTRLGGANRFAVATGVADTIGAVRGTKPAAVFVANGRVFPDALVASPAATATKGVILLSEDGYLPTETKAWLDAATSTPIYGIGGGGSRAVAGYPGVEAISGADRYEVARRVADRFFTGEWIATIVSGLNWPDATTGGALISQWQQPILLTKGTSLPTWTSGRLNQSRSATDLVAAFGGPASVDPAALSQAAKIAGYQTLYFGPDAPR